MKPISNINMRPVHFSSQKRTMNSAPKTLAEAQETLRKVKESMQNAWTQNGVNAKPSIDVSHLSGQDRAALAEKYSIVSQGSKFFINLSL